MAGQYVDLSHNNPPLSSWADYKKWSAQGDGTSRVAVKVTEGTNFLDPANHATLALSNGVDSLIWYHYARPDRNPGWAGAQAEVQYFLARIGNRLRPTDYLMLDYEGYPGLDDGPWLADWAWDWLHLASELARVSTNRVALYSYDDFIKRKLQDTRLAQFPLIYARYNSQKSPSPVPTPPAPWTPATMMAWQYSDAATVPGVAGKVDANVWLGLPTPPPAPPSGPDLGKVKSLLQQALQELG